MYKLLIVDDEKETRIGLRNYFPWQEIGFEIAGEAENGSDALSIMENEHIDVVLSDIKMPVMNGVELASEIFRKRLPVKVVFLSGHKEFEYAQKAIIYGVKNYIIKPTKYDELVEIFKALSDELSNGTVKRSVESSTIENKLISAVRQYIDKNLPTASLEGAAEQVFMTPQYLSKFFKEKTGQNYSDFLLAERMKKAKELLDDFQYKIYQVSELVGYANSNNFTRAFRKYYGKSPREARSE
ncbi:response regulator [Cohnella sp.]|uniref:response regulator transcription factor n=1 Tax=Cohnella sp. TaxID=1883426 RepID=UPI0035621A96